MKTKKTFEKKKPLKKKKKPLKKKKKPLTKKNWKTKNLRTKKTLPFWLKTSRFIQTSLPQIKKCSQVLHGTPKFRRRVQRHSSGCQDDEAVCGEMDVQGTCLVDKHELMVALREMGKTECEIQRLLDTVSVKHKMPDAWREMGITEREFQQLLVELNLEQRKEMITPSPQPYSLKIDVPLVGSRVTESKSRETHDVPVLGAVTMGAHTYYIVREKVDSADEESLAHTFGGSGTDEMESVPLPRNLSSTTFWRPCVRTRVPLCWHGAQCPWHRRGRCLFKHERQWEALSLGRTRSRRSWMLFGQPWKNWRRLWCGEQPMPLRPLPRLLPLVRNVCLSGHGADWSHSSSASSCLTSHWFAHSLGRVGCGRVSPSLSGTVCCRGNESEQSGCPYCAGAGARSGNSGASGCGAETGTNFWGY